MSMVQKIKNKKDNFMQIINIEKDDDCHMFNTIFDALQFSFLKIKDSQCPRVVKILRDGNFNGFGIIFFRKKTDKKKSLLAFNEKIESEGQDD